VHRRPVANGPFKYTGDGNIGNWPNVVDGALKLPVEHVPPGHGPAGGREVLIGQRAFRWPGLNCRTT
jgi:hypothetical protein